MSYVFKVLLSAFVFANLPIHRGSKFGHLLLEAIQPDKQMRIVCNARAPKLGLLQICKSRKAADLPSILQNLLYNLLANGVQLIHITIYESGIS